MSILSRFWHSDEHDVIDEELKAREIESSRELLGMRQNLRQTIQRVESGTKVFQTSAGIMRIMRGIEE